MSGITTNDDIIKAASLGRIQQSNFYKLVNTTAQMKIVTSWNANLVPPPGVFGTPLTARQVTNASTGALPYTNASGGRQMHLISAELGGSNAGSLYYLVDRLLEAPFNGTVTSGTFNSGTPVRIPSRDVNGTNNGDGCFMFLENAIATATASVNVTINYTDQGGNTGHTTGAINVRSEPTGNYVIVPTVTLPTFFPLAAGDFGVRAIESYTLSASLLSTRVNVVICRPLLILRNNVSGLYVAASTVSQLDRLPKLYDGTAMQWIIVQTLGANTINFFGNVTFGEG